MSKAYRNLYILSFGIFAVLNTELGIVSILPKLAQVTNVSISQAGYLISIFALTVTFIGPIFTVFALKINQKMALIFAQLLLMATNLIIILFPYYPVMMLARFIGGLGHPLFFTLALSYPTYTIPLEKRTQATAIILAGVNMAFIVGFPLISFLSNTFFWQAGFLFSIIANLIAIIGVIIFIPKQSNEPNHSEKLSFKSFQDRGFIISIPVIILSFTGMFIMYSYFSPYLKEILLVQPQDLTLALICFGFFGLMGNFITGLIPVAKTAIMFTVYALLFIMTFIALNFYTFQFPTLLMVSCWGFIQSGIILLGQMWFILNKTTKIEAINSMLVSSSNLGITLGSFLGGLFIKHIGISLLPLFSIVVFTLVILGVIINSRTVYKEKIQ